MGHPDGVYLSDGKNSRLVYHQGGDVVVMEAAGSAKGNAVTSFGSSGRKAESGAEVWGGVANDVGRPVTPDMLEHAVGNPPATPIIKDGNRLPVGAGKQTTAPSGGHQMNLPGVSETGTQIPPGGKMPTSAPVPASVPVSAPAPAPAPSGGEQLPLGFE